MATPESVGVSSERLKRLDAAMKTLVDSGKLAGAVTVLTRHGKTVNVTVNGRKDIRKPDLLDRDSIFRIYSMTKPVTGVAMMMLFEEGCGGSTIRCRSLCPSLPSCRSTSARTPMAR